jgi:Family of unknown function (DUF6492)
MTDPSRTRVETQMVVVTPTYAPDLDLFSDLHESVLRCFPADVRHLAIVNDSDLELFRRFEGPRCVVLGVSDVLPRSIRALPVGKLWVNFRRPMPPLRGWIVQQLVKLAAAVRVQERVVVMADSDLVFIRPVTVETFAPGGRVRLYKKDDGIDDSLPRHLRWHAVAHELLGLPPTPAPPLPDYVSSLNIWDREVTRKMLRRIEHVTGKRWLEAVGSEIHFSEWTLYGLFADELERARSVTISADSLCHSYWDPVPLTAEEAAAWLSALGANDVAYMISAKSNTPLSVRRAAHTQRYGR